MSASNVTHGNGDGGYQLLSSFEEDGKPSNDESTKVGGTTNTMSKSASMLELNVIRDMVQFGEAMDALSLAPGESTAASSNSKGMREPTDPFDSSERSSDDDANDQLLSTSPDTVACVPGGETSLRSSSDFLGARQAMAEASLSTRMQQDIQTIAEEGGTGGDVPLLSDRPLDVARPRRSASHGTPRRSSLKKMTSAFSADEINSSVRSADETKLVSRNVSFSSLEIRSYNVTIGDAPTSNGPAVALSWDYDPSATEEHEIDHYETYRTDEAPRRNKQEMLMPPAHRQYLLMREMGFSRAEIKEAMEEAKRVARQRQKTVKGIRMGLQPMEEALEKTRRRFSFKKKKKSTPPMRI